MHTGPELRGEMGGIGDVAFAERVALRPWR
ncbi:uncharacterized protein SOCE26_044850 [Sorangium cellulosum]|uniref:Uncharacterized protein n=1 Tax=Sorangium cellulosum TaxID=56 RepID=A0A2L0EUU8_SORCE|nr:uncharacterized protein SOCE26_044850 [Sorangium cellulosum]